MEMDIFVEWYLKLRKSSRAPKSVNRTESNRKNKFGVSNLNGSLFIFPAGWYLVERKHHSVAKCTG
ncbi:hypothetical protein DM01DRAFT_1339565 [Hesseltinella vesiculosa]|uniref:Uncharacterized protein n=1 Tax=Hesseltinella vesiculosa TaxID=101127 RepID=A0A1X2G6W4_9FUNG|nr:hypothetical protein DM01DRAFT_1339565 [Hesseltinella vesiculosa]